MSCTGEHIKHYNLSLKLQFSTIITKNSITLKETANVVLGLRFRRGFGRLLASKHCWQAKCLQIHTHLNIATFPLNSTVLDLDLTTKTSFDN